MFMRLYLLGNLPFFKIHVNRFMAWDDSPYANVISKCTLWVRCLVPFSEFWDIQLSPILWDPMNCRPPVSSVQLSYSVVYDSLRPHGLQHASPPCPIPASRTSSNSCPLNRCCHPTISSSVIPLKYAVYLKIYSAYVNYISIKLEEKYDLLSFTLIGIFINLNGFWGALLLYFNA